MSDIGAKVAELIAAGCDPGVAARVVVEAFVAGHQATPFHPNPVDESAERRRAWDRDRKRAQRGMRPSEGDWIALVAEVLARDGNKCTYCGTSEKLTADHVVPLTRGGSNETSNLTACCIPCNSKKGNRLICEWLPASSTVFHPDVHPNPVDANNASLSIKTTNTISEERERPKKAVHPTSRGHRLPADWQPTHQDRETFTELLSASVFAFELDKFRDHWPAQPGQKGVKLDWNMTFRNWMRNVRPPRGVKPLTAHQAERQTTREILDDLDVFATGRSGGSQDDLGFLPGDPSKRPQGLRSGTGGDVINLPAIGYQPRHRSG